MFWTFSYLYLWHTIWFHAEKLLRSLKFWKSLRDALKNYFSDFFRVRFLMAKRTILSATSTGTFTYVILGSCVFFLTFGVFLILAFANCLPGAVHVNWEWRPQMLGFAPSPVIFSPTNYYKDIDIFILILFYYEILIIRLGRSKSNLCEKINWKERFYIS